MMLLYAFFLSAAVALSAMEGSKTTQKKIIHTAESMRDRFRLRCITERLPLCASLDEGDAERKGRVTGIEHMVSTPADVERLIRGIDAINTGPLFNYPDYYYNTVRICVVAATHNRAVWHLCRNEKNYFCIDELDQEKRFSAPPLIEFSWDSDFNQLPQFSPTAGLVAFHDQKNNCVYLYTVPDDLLKEPQRMAEIQLPKLNGFCFLDDKTLLTSNYSTLYEIDLAGHLERKEIYTNHDGLANDRKPPSLVRISDKTIAVALGKCSTDKYLILHKRDDDWRVVDTLNACLQNAYVGAQNNKLIICNVSSGWKKNSGFITICDCANPEKGIPMRTIQLDDAGALFSFDISPYDGSVMLVRQASDYKHTVIDIVGDEQVSIEAALVKRAWWSRTSPTKIHCADYYMLRSGYELTPTPVDAPKALIPYLEQYRDFLAQKH